VQVETKRLRRVEVWEVELALLGLRIVVRRRALTVRQPRSAAANSFLPYSRRNTPTLDDIGRR
jgi:hypothetical protein